MLQLIPWVKSGPVVKLVLKKKKSNTTKEQKAPKQNSNKKTPNPSSLSFFSDFFFYRIIECFELEGTCKGHLGPTPKLVRSVNQPLFACLISKPDCKHSLSGV